MFVSKAQTAEQFRQEILAYLSKEISALTNEKENRRNLGKYEKDAMAKVIAKVAYLREFIESIHIDSTEIVGYIERTEAEKLLQEDRGTRMVSVFESDRSNLGVPIYASVEV